MGNKALKVLFLYNAIFVLAGGLLGPLYAVFIQNFEKSILVISLSWATFLISTTVFTFLISKVGDRIIEKEYLLMSGYLIRAIALLLFAFVNNFILLILLLILLCVGEAVGNPSFDTIFAEHLDKGRYVEEYADWKLIENLTVAVAAVIGGLVVSKFGFQILFLTMSALAVVSFLGVLLKSRSLL